MEKRLLVLISAAFVLAFTGCQGLNDPAVPSASTTADGTPDLDSPTGGYTTSDEQPAFGEADEYAVLCRESDSTDPSDPYSRIVDTIVARGARLYDFRAIWGHLAALEDSTSDDSCPLDWSGTLTFRGGIIAVERIIAFEPGDSLIRVDKSTIRWISRTGPSIDGIQVKLVVCAGAGNADSSASVSPALELVAGPFSRTFTLDELASLNLVETVDECGNGVSIMSALALPACLHGHLMGVWTANASDTSAAADTSDSNGVVRGSFKGVWFGAHGLVSGYLRGVYGTNGAGERVFFGKYIDTTGRFMGILRGTYGRRPERCARCEAMPRGEFRGEWVGANAEVKGRLRGHWIVESPGAGFFHGSWGMNCGR